MICLLTDTEIAANHRDIVVKNGFQERALGAVSKGFQTFAQK